MRNRRKLIAVVLAIALVLTSTTAVFAADAGTIANADKAVILKDLGLYSGQDAKDPKAGLENALTTQDALIFLSKLFGYEDAANALTADQVAKALAKFDDAASISDYARNVVAYFAANGILNGYTKNGKLFVGAKDTVTAARFATFMLKQMGYSVSDYRVSVTQLAETKGSKIDATLAGGLTRDDAVGMMYGALTAQKASGKTVIVDIVGDNADLKTKAAKTGLIEEPTQNSGTTGSTSSGGSTGSTGGGGSSSGDVTGPTVTSVSVEKNLSVKLTFNEVLKANTVEASNFTFKSVEDGEAVSFTVEYPVDSNKKVVRLNASEKLDDNTEYEVVVRKTIKDTSGNQMKNDYTTTFTVGDHTPPEIDKEDCRVVKADGKIYLKFSEPMDQSQMLEKSYYMVQPKDGADWRALDEDDEMSIISNKVVLIDLDEEVDSPDVEIKAIADLSGNPLFGSDASKTLKDINVELKSVEISSAALIATNKIKIVFDTELDLDTIDYTDVELMVNDDVTTPGSLKIDSVESQDVNDDGNTEIVATLNQDINTDAKYTNVKNWKVRIDIVTKDTTSSKSVFGAEIEPSQIIRVEDKTPPEVEKYKFEGDEDETPDVTTSASGMQSKGDRSYVFINFTESIEFGSLSILSFAVDDYTVKAIGLIGDEDDVVWLEVEANSDNTSPTTYVTQRYNICDTSNNEFVASDSVKWKVRFLHK